MSGRSRWGDAMRCLVCGAEMRLEEIALDETAPVSGFQRHTFKCSSCGDVEERLAFVKEHSQANAVASAPENEDDGQRLTGVSEAEPNFADAILLDAESSVLLTSAPENKDAVTPSFAKDVCGDIEQPLTLVSEAESSHADAIPPDLVPPVSPPSAAETEDGVAPTFANRVAAKLSRICRAVGRRLSHGGEQRSPVSDLAVPHISTPPCEPVSDPSIRPTWPALAEPVASRESDSYVDECENLLRRAIKKSSSQASASLAEADSAAPASVARPREAELETLTTALRPLETGRVGRINEGQVGQALKHKAANLGGVLLRAPPFLCLAGWREVPIEATRPVTPPRLRGG
jgi:hypothetical protein